MMARAKDLKRWDAWRRRLRRFGRSQLTVAGFCEAEGVSVASFYLWRKKLAEVDGAATGPTQAPSAGKAFAPVTLVGPPTVVAELPGGTRVHLPVGDPSLLRAALDELVSTGVRIERGGWRC